MKPITAAKKNDALNAQKYTNKKGTTVTAAWVAGTKQNPQFTTVTSSVQATRTNTTSQTKTTGKMRPNGKGKKNKKKKISTRNHSTRRVQDSPRSELARKETQETTQTDYAKERKVKPTAGERDIRSNNNTHTHKPKLRTGRSFPAFRVVNVTLGTAPSTGRTPSWRKTRERQNAVASLYTNRRIRARKTERVRKRTKKRRE